MFIPVLSAQYLNIYNTGDKSQATYKASEEVESKASITKESVKEEDILKKDKHGEDKYSDVNIDFNITTGETYEINSKVRNVKEVAWGSKGKKSTEMKVGVPIEVIKTP